MFAKVKYLLDVLDKVKVKGKGIVPLRPLSKISQKAIVKLAVDGAEGSDDIFITPDDWVTGVTDGQCKTFDEIPAYEVGATGYVKVAVSDISDLVSVVVDEETHEVTSITVPDILVQIDSTYIIYIPE